MNRRLPLVALLLLTSTCQEPPPGCDNEIPFIETATVTERLFVTKIPWFGTVEAEARVELRALTDGRVARIFAPDETRVERGTEILALGGPLIDERRARLAAEEMSIKKQLDLASERIERIRKDLAAHIKTRDDLASAEADRLALKARLEGVQASRSILDKSSSIRAPFTGIFTGRRVSAGQEVASGDSLGVLVAPGRQRIAAALFPPDDSVLEGRRAIVALASGTVEGTVSRVFPERDANGATRLFITGDALGRTLRPGQPVFGVIILSNGRPSPAVPVDAVVYDDAENAFVFVKASDSQSTGSSKKSFPGVGWKVRSSDGPKPSARSALSKEGAAYRKRRVTTGATEGRVIEIRFGLHTGDRIVVRGAYELLHKNFAGIYQVED